MEEDKNYNVEYAKKYYQENKERILKYQKDYYNENNKHRKKQIPKKDLIYKFKQQTYIIEFK